MDRIRFQQPWFVFLVARRGKALRFALLAGLAWLTFWPILYRAIFYALMLLHWLGCDQSRIAPVMASILILSVMFVGIQAVGYLSERIARLIERMLGWTEPDAEVGPSRAEAG